MVIKVVIFFIVIASISYRLLLPRFFISVCYLGLFIRDIYLGLLCNVISICYLMLLFQFVKSQVVSVGYIRFLTLNTTQMTSSGETCSL